MENFNKEYSKKVYIDLLSLTNDKQIPEDLLQETFYSAVKNINKFRNESSLKTWLYKIAKNKWIDYYKKSKKLNEVQIDNNKRDLISDTIQEKFWNKYDIIDVCKKIHELNENEKEIFYLRICMNLNFKDIGEILGKTEENTRLIFHRVKNRLKEVLK